MRVKKSMMSSGGKALKKVSRCENIFRLWNCFNLGKLVQNFQNAFKKMFISIIL